MSAYPKIAVVTPTKNRREHLAFQVEQMKRQTYPLEHITWVITDSSTSAKLSWEEILADPEISPSVLYKRLPADTLLGKSRNISLDLACKLDVSYILFMDDDDIICADRFRLTVEAMEEYPDFEVAGCSRILVFLLRGESLVEIGSFTDLSGGAIQHALEPTLAVTPKYAATHFFEDTDPRGLLRPFLADFTTPILALRAEDVCIIIGHDRSTFDKYQLVYKKAQFNVIRHEAGYGLERLWDEWGLTLRMRELFMAAHGDSM
jgi:glycosyltransferase involved in cell wall biosynthesis